jgi:hypothetical protein
MGSFESCPLRLTPLVLLGDFSFLAKLFGFRLLLACSLHGACGVVLRYHLPRARRISIQESQRFGVHSGGGRNRTHRRLNIASPACDGSCNVLRKASLGCYLVPYHSGWFEDLFGRFSTSAAPHVVQIDGTFWTNLREYSPNLVQCLGSRLGSLRAVFQRGPNASTGKIL